MCFGSTHIFPHEGILIAPAPHLQQVQPAPARKVVRVPAPTPQMRVPTTHAR